MMTTTARAGASSRGRLITLWFLSGLVGLVFIGAGGAKLAGVAEMVELFAKGGLRQWFRYFTGFLEVAAGIGLLMSRYAFYAAVLLAIVMVGVHRACNHARQFFRRPGRAIRPHRDHRLFAKP
jgi:putative oxidoreductase